MESCNDSQSPRDEPHVKQHEGASHTIEEAHRASETPRTSRDVLYESIGIGLVNAGVLIPATTFVDDVRRVAGFRVSPREVAVAVDQAVQSAQQVTVEQVATIVAGTRGNRSQRQQRHAADWRALGALLSMRGLDGSPSGQRAFIGAARSVAGQRATDSLLLGIALALADLGAALESNNVGLIARRLATSAPDLSRDDIATLVKNELRAIGREKSAAGRPNRRSSSASRRPPSQPTIQIRRFKRGGKRRTVRVLPQRRRD